MRRDDFKTRGDLSGRTEKMAYDGFGIK